MLLITFYREVLDKIYQVANRLGLNPVCVVKCIKDVYTRICLNTAIDTKNLVKNPEKTWKYIELAYIWSNLPDTKNIINIVWLAKCIRSNVKYVTQDDLDYEFRRAISYLEDKQEYLVQVCK